MTDVKKILAGAKRPQDSLSVCLDGELIAAYEKAFRALDDAKKHAKEDDSLSAYGVAEAREQFQQLREQVKQVSVDIVVRAVGRRRFNELSDEHPAREGNVGDLAAGFNVDTMGEALLVEGIVSPELTDDERTELLDEVLTDGQYNDLVNLAFRLNRRGVSVPFSFAA